MSDDEKLQIKKDTLWDIHEAKREVACLERKVDAAIEAMQEVASAWDAGLLGTVSGGLLRKKSAEDYGTVVGESLKGFPDASELAGLVDELIKAKKKQQSLRRSFDNM